MPCSFSNIYVEIIYSKSKNPPSFTQSQPNDQEYSFLNNSIKHWRCFVSFGCARYFAYLKCWFSRNNSNPSTVMPLHEWICTHFWRETQREKPILRSAWKMLTLRSTESINHLWNLNVNLPILWILFLSFSYTSFLPLNTFRSFHWTNIVNWLLLRLQISF